jgi:hypothetical protein
MRDYLEDLGLDVTIFPNGSYVNMMATLIWLMMGKSSELFWIR